MRQIDRDAIREWEEYKQDIANSTPIDENKSPEEIEKHRLYLESHPIEWIQFFFPKYAKYPFAPFHKKAIKRILNNQEWYEVLSWSRELAKSTVVMFIVMYLVLTGKKKSIMLGSATQDSAERLLAPYRANFESNGRIRQYYGEQVTLGEWTSAEFKAKCGAAFRALGAGNAPRGSRNEEVRPDVILMDDFDTDEACRNPETIKKNWDWFENALYPTRSISEPTTIIWCGNIIAKDCCIVRAGAMADHWDIVNIRDKNGNSTWPEKNTEELIDRCLSKITSGAQQREYYNNPVSEGKIFKNLAFGNIPSLRKFKFLVIYGDPAPGESKKKSACFKAVWLMGRIGNKRYVIKGYLDKVLNSEFIEWYVKLLQYVGGKTNVYCYMENNKLQDPFFRQVFKPHVNRIKKERDISLNIIPDEERKTDKATRIESNLEPLDREGELIFNEDEKGTPHMEELISQFKLFEMHMPYAVDGPDCIEGGNRALERKTQDMQPTTTIPRKSIRNKHKL